MKGQLKHAYLTDKGIRQINQDFVQVMSETENCAGYNVAHCGALFAVADGVGGQQAGEVAARMACEACDRLIKQALKAGSTDHLTAQVIHVNAAPGNTR